MLALLPLLLLAPEAHAKKPKKEKAPPVEAAAEARAPKAAAGEPAWADAPPDDWLPKDGPVRGRIGAVAGIELPRVALTFHVAPLDSTELTTTATLKLEQVFFGGTPIQTGGNQVWLDLPPALAVGTFRSEAPARPPFAQRATAPDGADAVNWQSAEVVWVLELTTWDVKVPEAPPAEDAVIGTASGRVAVMLRDGWGGAETGFVAGTFDGIEVRAAAASW